MDKPVRKCRYISRFVFLMIYDGDRRKYKVVIVDDERTAIDALRRELEPYREFEVKGIAGMCKGKR